ncbi:MAG: SPOR domain-containing protein [Spirochaetaceae bacterium]
MRHIGTIFIRPFSYGVLLFACLFSIIAITTSYGENDGEQWNSLSAEEKTDWLAENREDPHFYDRLLNTAEAFEEPSRSKQILEGYLPLLDKPEERYKVLLNLARMEESLGNYGNAQTYYQSAAFVRRGERDYNALFHSALLLIEQGEFSLAEVQLRRIHENTDSAELMRKAQLNLARLYALSGENEQAESAVAGIMEEDEMGEEDGGAEIYYLVYAVSSHLKMEEQAQAARQRLIEKFPKSPEAQLVQGLAEEAPSMEKVFGLLGSAGEIPVETAEIRESDSEETREQPQQEETQGTTQEQQKARGVQTGSFRDIENADYMAAELEKKGFTPRVEEKTVNETKYHQVIVPIPEDTEAQSIMIKLKEEGFEGYPVY